MTVLRLLLPLISLLALPRILTAANAESLTLSWPKPTREMRPWTRWWWLGSAVDATNLTRELTAFRDAGLGGVEICPIYGAKGAEARFLRFLSPEWMEALSHVTREAERLGLGVDLTTGTGWPFGGPQVSASDASARLHQRQFQLVEGQSLDEPLPRGHLAAVQAYSSAGATLDLTSAVSEGRLRWTAPAGSWRIDALTHQQPVQKVKRAAPGGEGNVVDPYSTEALSLYLAPFDSAFSGFRAPSPRAQFHDSFEYFAATWTPEFLEQFEERRGYDLRLHLPALSGDGDPDLVARVWTDYCETLQDLHLDYLAHWTRWAHARGSRTRNQGHGGPGNLLDFYAAADIPETEIFRNVEEAQLPLLKFASSAAHVAGRTLASSESFTWLGEHFQITLAEAREAADLLFLAGVNHVFFHGIPYSPADIPWPGWLFYASTHFGLNGGLWPHLPAFNAYLTRVQSILQGGSPDNEILVYWPQHDAWVARRRQGASVMFTVHDQDQWLWNTPFHRTVMSLADQGYSADFISDRQLGGLQVTGGGLGATGARYRVLWLPEVQRMPVATVKKVLHLARDGATIVVQGKFPSGLPGLGQLAERTARLRELLSPLDLPAESTEEIVQRPVGRGLLILGSDPSALARAAGLAGEPMAGLGLRFIRRARPAGHGHDYFIVNRSTHAVNQWVELAVPCASAVLMDPSQSHAIGLAATRRDSSPSVFLNLHPRQSVVLRTFAERPTAGETWPYLAEDRESEPIPLTGPWRIEFGEGGPERPASYVSERLESWTRRDDPEARRYAGTAWHRMEFEYLHDPGPHVVLDLGRVCESARVRLNGSELGTVFSPPYRIAAGAALRRGTNRIEIEVANLAANRIADLDRRGVPWKAFHEINFVNRDYRPFDASNWPLRDSGLLGPVTLIPTRTRTVPLP